MVTLYMCLHNTLHLYNKECSNTNSDTVNLLQLLKVSEEKGLIITQSGSFADKTCGRLSQRSQKITIHFLMDDGLSTLIRPQKNQQKTEYLFNSLQSRCFYFYSPKKRFNPSPTSNISSKQPKYFNYSIISRHKKFLENTPKG